MDADQFSSVQHQAFGGCLNLNWRIERITQYRMPLMRQMNSQLMRSASIRRKLHAAAIGVRIEA